MNDNLEWEKAIQFALEYLNTNHWVNDSRIYDVVYQGQSYPPKEVYRKAVDFFLEANPEGFVPKLGGGKPTNEFIQKHGFTVIGNNSFNSSPRICKMQMKSDADGKNYADEVLADNRITGHIDFVGKKFENLNKNDIVAVHKGSHPHCLVKIISKIDDKSKIQGESFGIDYYVTKLSYYSDIPNSAEFKKNFKGFGPEGSFTILKTKSTPTYQFITDWLDYLNPKYHMKNYIKLLKTKKQIILQGPPGTGKTRLAKQLASELCDSDERKTSGETSFTNKQIETKLKDEPVIDSSTLRTKYKIDKVQKDKCRVTLISTNSTYDISYNGIRKALKDRLWEKGEQKGGFDPYNAAIAKYLYEKRGQNEKVAASKNNYSIIQFHPSYTYEDFVRGISVKNNEQGDIEYKTENRIFAKFAEHALENYLNHNKENATYSKEKKLEEYFSLFVEKIIDDIEGNTGFLKLTENVGLVSIDEDAFRYRGNAEGWIKNGNRMLFKDIKRAFLDDNVERQDLKKNSNLSGLAKQHASYFVRVLKMFYEFLDVNNLGFDNEILENEPLKNYVLIIDEINRANLSSVLGELIYALEYRNEPVESIYDVEGNNTIILPPNLYIIGTMNTADRSVGVMDYAVRRRFAFVDVLPKILDESSLESKQKFALDLFRKVSALFIENPIEEVSNGIMHPSEYLSDEFRPEYVWLGHSYFIYEDDNFDIQLKYEIIPILKEYVKDGILKETALEVIATL